VLSLSNCAAANLNFNYEQIEMILSVAASDLQLIDLRLLLLLLLARSLAETIDRTGRPKKDQGWESISALLMQQFLTFDWADASARKAFMNAFISN
jgi:uncharacterized membrane-anchored protein